ncbi:MAG: FdtA/QdtA family cupin domain-containing protein [Candidatus Taylorbacteria bacterium]|nr:FdtA/QdtA family cupin domain-containing protein [Candidatus Taylorbacteria bacterium]
MKRPFAKKPGVIGLQTFDDSRDGCLYIGEATKNVPFEIKRFYCINNLPGKTAVRGKHAHKKLHQYIFCMNGSFTLELDNGTNKKRVVMDDPAHGISLGPLIWHTMSDFSKDCVILVVADDYYDESDYIRNYEDFIQQIKSTKH